MIFLLPGNGLKAPTACGLWLVFAGFLLQTACAQPVSRAPRSITLQYVLNQALLNNRTLQIERINPEIARLTLATAKGYYDPLFTTQARHDNFSDPGGIDPVNPSSPNVGLALRSDTVSPSLSGYLPSGLTYNFSGNYVHVNGFRNGLNVDSYRAGAGVSLQQPLLRNSWIDRPRWTIRVNKGEVKVSELGVRFVAMDVLNRTGQAYYDLVFAWESLEVQNALLATRETFLQGILKQVQLGRMTSRDENLARSQLGSVQISVIAASNLVALAGNQIKGLIGSTTTNWTEELLTPADRSILFPEKFDVATSWSRGLTRRPDLLQLVQKVENAEVSVNFRLNQLLPAFDLIGSYARKGSSFLEVFPPDTLPASSSTAFDEVRSGLFPSHMFGAIFSVPLSFSAERANYRASKQQRAQAQLLVKSAEETILREISDAIFNVDSSAARIEAASRAAQFAQEALKGELEKLQAGASTVFFVLQLQSDLASAQTSELLARRDYLRAVFQLQFSEGTLLDQRGLVLELK
ncbi:MAG: outer membrane protein TolC [Verrucomicrobiales bacterium]|nr:outer membrane protein TolC [Verrucomicrobiales bacterium]